MGDDMWYEIHRHCRCHFKSLSEPRTYWQWPENSGQCPSQPPPTCTTPTHVRIDASVMNTQMMASLLHVMLLCPAWWNTGGPLCFWLGPLWVCVLPSLRPAVLASFHPSVLLSVHFLGFRKFPPKYQLQLHTCFHSVSNVVHVDVYQWDDTG